MIASTPAPQVVCGRSQRELQSNSLVFPAGGDGDQPWLDRFHPGGLSPRPHPETRFPRDPGGFLGTSWHQVSRATWAVPGERLGAPRALHMDPNVAGWDARILPGSLGRAEGKNWFGQRHIFFFPLGLSVKNHPRAVDSSQGKPGGVAGREQDGALRQLSPGLPPACRRGAALASVLPARAPAAGDVSRPPRRIPLPAARGPAVWGRGLLVSEDDTTCLLRLHVRTLLSWRRQHPDSLGEAKPPPGGDPERGPLRKPLALGFGSRRPGCGSWLLSRGRPARPPFTVQDPQDLKAFSLGGLRNNPEKDRSPKKSPKTARAWQN